MCRTAWRSRTPSISRFRKARKVFLPQVGHMSNMEAPGRFNALLLDFLSEPR
jgi:pimeloyl-ACP methyl ester carboxylesterase